MIESLLCFAFPFILTQIMPQLTPLQTYILTVINTALLMSNYNLHTKVRDQAYRLEELDRLLKNVPVFVPTAAHLKSYPATD